MSRKTFDMVQNTKKEGKVKDSCRKGTFGDLFYVMASGGLCSIEEGLDRRTSDGNNQTLNHGS